MKETLKYSAVLFSICFFAAILLSAVASITQPIIEETKAEQENNAIKEVMPQARGIEKVEEEGLVYYKAKDFSGNNIGYVFISEAKGYSSVIRAVVSITPEGEIIAVKVLEQNETPGIGTQITEEKFLSRFKGKKALDNIDSISGATVSSSALIDSVKQTLKKIIQ
ncbi:MAG: hypothetical protein DRP74_00265 [Candidatus Omnitrophota bacterium]|nr:MAG: hypothetical protein DRP74_00265 [Candidatus Omnitrophota bacterium]